MIKGGSVYIMTNQHHSVLYTGVTSDLFARVTVHKERIYPKSFTSRYNLDKLVYYENYHLIVEAIAREKQIKGGSRKKKELLISSINPNWNDLFEEIKEW
ncbi:MAG TPA: GIY-YIG nuclease family protein [Cyclobacteriaceae bacterium]